MISFYSGDDWHLRKTNWCGEAAEMLNDLDATLDQCQLRNGDHLLLMEGHIPPKVCCTQGLMLTLPIEITSIDVY